MKNKTGGQIFTNEKFTLPLQGKHGKIINSSGQVLGINNEPNIDSHSSFSEELDPWKRIKDQIRQIRSLDNNEDEIGVILQDSSDSEFQNWFRGMPNSSGHFTLKNSITGRFLTATSIRSTKTTITGKVYIY